MSGLGKVGRELVGSRGLVLAVERQRIIDGVDGHMPAADWCAAYREWVDVAFPGGSPRDCYRCDGEGSYDGQLCEVCRGFGRHKIERPCPVCSGLRWVRAADVQLGHPQFGLTKACPVCSGEARDRVQVDVALALQQAHVPSGYSAFRLGTYLDLGLTPSQTEAALLAGAWASIGSAWEHEHGKTGLVLAGGTGVGKTGLAIGALAEAAQFVETPRFASWLGLLAQVRHSWRRDSDSGMSAYDVVETYGRARVLVLDDFGTSGRGTAPEHAIELAEALWEARTSRAGLWTLVTTNLRDWAAVEAELGSRVSSRMQGHCVWQNVLGPDMRLRPHVVESRLQHATGGGTMAAGVQP